MESSGSGTPVPEVPPELRQRIGSLLPPNDLALSWRLTCKEAAHRCSEPHQRTARVADPLPGHAANTPWCIEAAAVALRQLTFRRKLLMLSTAASGGCEASVEFAWQLLQPHVFPELLRTEHYRELLRREQHVSVEMQNDAGPYAGFWSTTYERYKFTDVGSAAVSSGLSHMLPSLESRCPGLVDPGATLEAAAQHCDLAGLQAAWELLQERLTPSIIAHTCSPGSTLDADVHIYIVQETVRMVWWRVMGAAARSSTPDAVAKMAWVLQKKPVNSPVGSTRSNDVNVCGAAAASGDLSRLRWLRNHGFPWCTGEVLQAVVQHADLPFLQQLEQEGGYLPPPGHEAWSSSSFSSRAAVKAAAGAARDAVGKLRWLAGSYGVGLAQGDAVEEAAWAGNLEAVQLLVGHCRGQHGTGGDVAAAQPAQGAGGAAAALPKYALAFAVCCKSVPTAAWLHEAVGYPLHEVFYLVACANGDLPMVRWLLDAGCPREQLGLGDVTHGWPSGSATDGDRLLEAVQLLAAAGWPATVEAGDHPLAMAARGGQPWWVLCGLRELLPVEHQEVDLDAAKEAAATGCEATLEWLVGMGVCDAYGGELETAWYAGAAKHSDLGTLACLRRLGVPLREGVVAAAVRDGAPVPALRWLVEQGAPWSSLEVREALTGLEERLRGTAESYSGYRQQVMGEVKAWLEGLLLGGGAAP